MHNRIFFAVFLCKVHGLCLVFLVMQIVTWLTNNYDNERSKDSGEKPDGYTKNVLKTRFAVPELPFLGYYVMQRLVHLCRRCGTFLFSLNNEETYQCRLLHQH